MDEIVIIASARFCGLAEVSSLACAVPGMRSYDRKANCMDMESAPPLVITGQGLLRDRRGTRVRTPNAS